MIYGNKRRKKREENYCVLERQISANTDLKATHNSAFRNPQLLLVYLSLDKEGQLWQINTVNKQIKQTKTRDFELIKINTHLAKDNPTPLSAKLSKEKRSLFVIFIFLQENSRVTF